MTGSDVDGWRAGTFLADTKAGACPVLAYLWKAWALDFRSLADEDRFPACWVLSHVPTGLAIMGLIGSWDDARALAERFDAMSDRWLETTDPASLKFLGPQARAIKNSYGDHAVNPAETIGQWMMPVLPDAPETDRTGQQA